MHNLTLKFDEQMPGMTLKFDNQMPGMTLKFDKNADGVTLGLSNSGETLQLQAPSDNGMDLTEAAAPQVEAPVSPEALEAWEADTDSDDEEPEYLPPKAAQVSVPWTKAENKILVEGRKASHSWTTIANKLPGRTHRAARSHYTYKYGSDEADDDDEPPRKKSKPPPPLPEKPTGRGRRVAWTEKEDDILKAGRSRSDSWSSIMENLPHRTALSVKSRWQSIKHL